MGGSIDPNLLLSVESGNTVERSVHVSGGDGVDADVVFGPFSSKRLGQLDDASFGGVIARLLLRIVDDRAGHGCNENDGSRSLLLDHLTANGLRDEEGAVNVDIDESSEFLGGVVFSWYVGAEKC